MAGLRMHAYSEIDAWGYDEFTALTGYARAPRRLAKEFQRVAGTLNPGMKILDFGCGTGRLTAAFRKVHAGALITGMEPSEAMAQRYLKKFSNTDVGFIMGGYDERYGRLQARDQEYDAVVSTGVFDHIHITSQMIKEFLRILKPEGWLAFTFERHGGKKPHKVHAGQFHSHADSFVRQVIEGAEASVLYQDRMLGYVFPRLARFGLVIARKNREPSL